MDLDILASFGKPPKLGRWSNHLRLGNDPKRCQSNVNLTTRRIRGRIPVHILSPSRVISRWVILQLLADGRRGLVDILTQYLLKHGLDGVFKVFGRGFKYVFGRLSEVAGRDRPTPYESVSAYWFEGIDGGVVGHGSKVKIRGVISMYVPATPRHPRSIPGRQIETWLNSRTPTKNFAHHDFLLWNDGILAPPPSLSRKAILGLNDRFGFVGQGGVPIIIDLTNPKHKSAHDKLQLAKPTGFECTVTGKLTPFATPEILAFGFSKPELAHPVIAGKLDLPNFVLKRQTLKLESPIPCCWAQYG
jgi:hypothetical protein